MSLEERASALAGELSESLTQQNAMSEILRVMASSPTDLQPVLNAVAENAARICEANDALIYRFDGHRIRGVAGYGPLPGDIGNGPRAVDSQTIPGRVVMDRQTVYIHDLYAVPESELRASFLRKHNTRTVLATPLLCQGNPIGVIMIRRVEVRPFSDRQIALLETFADQAVIAIENVRLFQALQTRNGELTESLTQQTATSEILRAIASSPTDLQPVLNTVAESAARICEANDALIYRFDGRRFEGVAEFGPLPGNLGKGPPGLDRRSVPGRVVIDRKTVHVHDLTAVPGTDLRADFLRKHGTRTILATPLLREGHPIGLIMIRRMEVRPFSDRQIALLETFAAQAVIAIENVRLFHETQDKNRQLQIANERLQELDRLKSDFVANVSHELRTPLTAIKGAVDLILREVPGPLTEKQMHYLTRVRSNTQHLAGLINDLLDLSKIEEGKIELQAERVSLGGLVHEVMETLRPIAAEKSIELAAKLEPSALVWADRDKVTQVLTNLIGNAIKFTPVEGRMMISSTSTEDGWVRVSVSDTGPGISMDERERIFDKFYQIAPNGQSKPKGTGLGLTICKTLVELHGGTIWVDSEQRGGSVFHFTLPAVVETKPPANDNEGA